MIIETEQIEIERSRTFKQSNFKMKPNLAILDLLRNSLYSDKILAQIREHSSNAIDSHARSKKKSVPINVTLPTTLDPQFKVRDFGAGLDESGIFDIYASYGESDKVKSNDEIGAFGIGAKSYFGYGSKTATITSVNQGVKRSYAAYIDESQLGMISLLTEEPTDEPSGMEISIPVKQGDIYDFNAKTAEFFKFWEVKPEFKNLVIPIPTLDWSLKKDNWGILKSSTPKIVMGGVAYNLDVNAITGLPHKYNALINAGLILFAPIGAIDIAGSRETVSDSEKTSKFIGGFLKIIEEEIRDSILLEFKKATSLYEAKKLYYEFFQHFGSIGNKLREIVTIGDIQWEGQVIDSYTIPITLRCQQLYKQRWRRRKYNVDSCYGQLDIFPDIQVYYATEKVFDIKRASRYLKEKLSLANDRVYFIEARESEVLPWATAIGIPSTIVKCIDTIIPPRAPRVYTPRAKRSSPQIEVYIVPKLGEKSLDKLDLATAVPAYTIYKKGDSIFFDEECTESMRTSWYQIGKLLPKLEDMMDIRVVHFTKSSKLDKSIWIPFYPAVKAHLKSRVVSFKARKVNKDAFWGTIKAVLEWMSKNQTAFKSRANPFNKLVSMIAWEEEEKFLSNALFAQFGIKFDDKEYESRLTRVEELQNSLLERYPLFTHIPSNQPFEVTLDYIRGQDAIKK